MRRKQYNVMAYLSQCGYQEIDMYFLPLFNNFYLFSFFPFGCTLRHVRLPYQGSWNLWPLPWELSLNHWTTRDVLLHTFLFFCVCGLSAKQRELRDGEATTLDLLSFLREKCAVAFVAPQGLSLSHCLQKHKRYRIWRLSLETAFSSEG